MRILVLAVHFEVTGARYIIDAFRRLGHDVKHYGQIAELKDVWGIDVDPKYKWMPHSLMELDAWGTPDLIVIADTLTPDYVVPKMYRNVPVVVWSQDNHVRNSRQAQNSHLSLIKHYFLAHKHGKAQPVTHDDETWLPCATDPIAFPSSPIPYDQREYDICCVGVMYPRRKQLVELLKREGFKVFAATGLVYEEYKNAYHNSRMSLCVSADGDVAQRVFETLGMGCLVLTDPLDDLLDDKTNHQLGLRGFSVYWSDNELVNRAQEFISTEREAAIAATTITPQLIRRDHTWDVRAQVVINWYNKEYGNVHMVEAVNQHIDSVEPEISAKKPYLNLGCGTTHLPSAKPAGHDMIDSTIYEYPLWTNVDKVKGVGADKTFDLFTYPWPLEDNSHDGALCAHILEHIPHEIKVTDNSERAAYLLTLQDGWYAFMSELYRVLTPDAIIHIVSPYGWSDGGITDPSHTRYLTMNTFTHSMTPQISDGSTFKYNNGGINLQIDGNPQYRITPMFAHLKTQDEVAQAMMTRLNVIYDFYVRLKVIK